MKVGDLVTLSNPRFRNECFGVVIQTDDLCWDGRQYISRPSHYSEDSSFIYWADDGHSAWYENRHLEVICK